MFEDTYAASDSFTLEQLKELSSKRRLIEDSINESSSITDAIAREMAGGLTSHTEQVICQYLDFCIWNLENRLSLYILSEKKLIFFPFYGYESHSLSVDAYMSFYIGTPYQLIRRCLANTNL